MFLQMHQWLSPIGFGCTWGEIPRESKKKILPFPHTHLHTQQPFSPSSKLAVFLGSVGLCNFYSYILQTNSFTSLIRPPAYAKANKRKKVSWLHLSAKKKKISHHYKNKQVDQLGKPPTKLLKNPAEDHDNITKRCIPALHFFPFCFFIKFGQ